MLCRPPKPGHPADDLLEELPPLDDDDDQAIPRDDLTDLGPMTLDEDPDRDDLVASDLDIGSLIDETEALSSSLEDDAQGPTGVDFDLSLGEAMEGKEGDEITGIADDDLCAGLDDIPDESIGDQDDVAMGASGDDIEEADLPELDSDDEADLPGGLRLDDEIELSEVQMPSWGEPLWQQVSSPLVAEALDCLSISGDLVVGGGQGLHALRWKGQSDGSVLAIDGQSPEFPNISSVCAISNDSLLFISGGQLFETTSLLQTVIRLQVPHQQSESNNLATIARLGNSPEFAVVETTGGKAFLYSRASETFQSIEVKGRVRALCNEGKALWLLEERDGALWVGKTLDGRQIETIQLEGADAILKHGPVHLAVRGESLAVWSDAGHLFYSSDGGQTVDQTHLPSELRSLCFASIGAKCQLLACIYVESEDKSYLLAGTPETGFERRADLSPRVTSGFVDGADDSEGIGATSAMIWDESRGVLWIAARFGLALWQPSITT